MGTAALTLLHPPDHDAPAFPPRGSDELLVRRHVRAVWRFLRLLGAAADEADDLTQETFVVALQKDLRDRTPPQVAAFLRLTARHLFLRSRQRHGRRAELLAAAADRLFARDCGDDGGDGRVQALRECVAGLEERSRRLVRLFYGESRSRAEIAAALGLQETGVKTALQRVRAALKQCLERKKS